MKCTSCGKKCYEDNYPEVVFRDAENIICENCSIDYEKKDGKVQLRHFDIRREPNCTKEEMKRNGCTEWCGLPFC